MGTALPDGREFNSNWRIQILLRQLTEEVNASCSVRSRDADEILGVKEELEAVKHAYFELQEEKREVDNRLEIMERHAEIVMGAERRVLCIIDGDGLVFSRGLIQQGRDGGLKAARALNDALRAHVGTDDNYQLWTYCFLNRIGLSRALNLGSNAPLLDAFLNGFNQAGGMTFAVDTGYGKEVADARIRDLLELWSHSVHTMKIYFGGCHDGGYVPTLEALIAHDLGSKLVLLPGAHQLPGRIAALELPVLDVPGVFEREKLVMPTWGLVPSSVMSPPPTPTKAKTPPPASKPRSPISPSASAIRYLDPSIPLSRNKPPPCNSFYLRGACFAESCKYGHMYTLRPGDKERMAAACKTQMCISVEKGIACPLGEECLYRHLST